MLKKRIYFDHAATTKLDSEVLDEMLPFMKNKFGNSSSVHYFGQKAASGVDWAREEVARFFDCDTDEIIFTSGATESNNMAIQGLVNYYWQHKKQKPHIIISNIEHSAVLETAKRLEKLEKLELSFLEVNNKGIVHEKDLQNLVKDNTVLVSVMYVNNEIGTIQPIPELGKIINKLNQDRKQKIYFHTDAVQAVNYLNCKVNYLHVDLMSISGHKFYGPKGVGVLYKRKGTTIEPLVYGGHHEFNFRPGTVNTSGVVGLAKALQLVEKNQKKENARLKKLRDKVESLILKQIDNSFVNGHLEKRIPSLTNISLPGAEGESILMMLDMEGIAVSTGSACASGSLEPSHVVTAIGVGPEGAHASLRISLGKENNEKQIKDFIKILKPIIEKLRQMAPK